MKAAAGLVDPPGVFERLNNAWQALLGQKSVPNFNPYFMTPSTLMGGNLLGNSVQQYPGMFHPIVYSCCRSIVDPYNMIPHELYKVDMQGQPKPDERPVLDHPILRLMKAPNPFLSGTNFFEAIWWCLLLPTIRTSGGQAFIVGGVPTNFRKGQIPSELWVFSDNVMEPKTDSKGVLTGWKLVVGSGNLQFQQDYGLDEVIRVNLYNPYNLARGLSPLSAAMTNVGMDARSMEYNTKFFDNNAAVSGIITPKERLDQDQIDIMKRMVEERVSGVSNAGSTWILPFAAEYDRLSLTHVDMAYTEMSKINTERIIGCYGLNKYALGLYEDINNATAKTAKKQVWDDAILPRANVIWMELNESWIRFTGDRNLRLRGDLTKVEALQEGRSEKIKDAKVLYEMGVPAAEALRSVEFPIDSDSYPWLEEEPKKPSMFGELPAKEEKPPAKILIEAVSRQEPAPLPAPLPRVEVKADEREKLSEEYTQKLFIPGEKALLPVVHRFFNGQRNRFLDRVDEIFSRTVDVKKLKDSDFALNDKPELVAIVSAFGPPLLQQAKRTLAQVRAELKRIQKLDADATEAEVRAYLKTRLLRLSEINATTFDGVEDDVAEILAQGIKDELAPAELKKKLKEGIGRYFDDTRRGGAMTIARTETAVVSSGIRFEAFEAAGIGKHEWLSAKDDRVRATHAAEDGHVVKVGDEFPATHLHYPSDPEGEAGETINCRCVALPVEEKE